ncbi:class A rhodopsin-like G-protein coupled receptor GPRcck1, putative [Pediculus humanus corporis]|uniref:Gastrin/cholecystokinin type B receptor n=1 Tax=Pediculus humanus subsp. corporis TaxID=121224 RepID=E0W443_PEDHC|nr:class A rhodopsin-like G-protein coupled receptor GPRcck1, putative [Pediculus humanus corporis]EEB20399.1 class A rhodopsin-like G-protein coupled receptor GPRcck1, putative [Pediculus humanus corporis]
METIYGNDTNIFDYYWSDNLTSFSLKYSKTLLETLWKNGKWEIPLYSIIFFLAVVGNIVVILTLVKNIRMRTNTNVFLLNLAVSDLILAVLCMPFTLIGTLLRDFVFGETMCKLVPYLQATSVAVSVWTLVAISIERYYAICHPLRSRRWQTLSHAYHLICYIWTGSTITMLPIFILTELQPTNKGRHKCREKWPNGDYERIYNLLLDLLLLLIPLLALGVTYYLISITLWRDLSKKSEDVSYQRHEENSKREKNSSYDLSDEYNPNNNNNITTGRNKKKLKREIILNDVTKLEVFQSIKSCSSISLRHNNYERSLRKKQLVIKMLFVVVLEFFVCWTPLYVINTLALFWPHLVYRGKIGYKMISFCQLLAYTSGCCNPITYCFMNKGFRTWKKKKEQ